MTPLLHILDFLALVITMILLIAFIVKWIAHLTKQKAFPRKTLFSTLIGLALFSGIFVYLDYFFTFDRIDRSAMQIGPEVPSPEGRYTAHAYYEPYGGAAGGVNVWIEIENHASSTVKTVYYADANPRISLTWVDEQTLAIENAGGPAASDRNATLNVDTEIYHDTGLACQSLLMKNDYEQCYRHEK
ncbi:hypothetical protein CDO73_10545 [Saccharibacillus sp. O23]|uniref:DUF5412 family protein n=1 Tax=Saccharibacillus sp. O23 TaxID=2009338 RepID=UPI000B4E407D|nr:DUF5412 family protein [Saccharibacillus sp. O23]OWR30356.1 hypothetical protein CDO73_10545 [Saccharibacillus sp. O23]